MMPALYTGDINSILLSLFRLLRMKHPTYLGALPVDYLKQIEINEYPSCVVINLDKSNQSGSHWVCAYFDTERNVEFFDSYAIPLSKYKHVNNFLKVYSKNTNCRIIESGLDIQSDQTDVCGFWVINFLFSRAQVISLSNFLDIFSDQSVPGYYDTFVKENVLKTYC